MKLVISLPTLHMKTVIAILALALAASSGHAAQAKSTKSSAKSSGPMLQPNPRKLNPAPGVVVPAEVKAELAAGVAELGKRIDALRKSSADPTLIPDVQIYYNAVKYALEDDIFTSTNQFASARAHLKQGLERAKQLANRQPAWNTKAGLLEIKKQMETAAAAAAAKKKQPAPPPLTHVPLVRGYVSKIDGSVQPYGLRIPITYLTGSDKKRRLDFWLHGRGDTLNEIAFIDGQQKGGSQFLPDDAFVLEPYGRFMNAFKFAGEVDVFEGLADAQKHYPIDPDRVSMRGFSMGGAGTWHLGVHHPDQFAAVNPGAGFVDVKNYQKLGDKLDTIPWWEQKLWNLYDPLACPINLVNTTLVAYSGEDDAQKAAADMMEAALKKEGVKMTHIIGPNTGHKYEPEAKKVVAGLVDAASAKGINHQPKKVTLVTHSLKFNKAHWVTIQEMEKHWERASLVVEVVTTNEVKITTSNVNRLGIEVPREYFTPSKQLRVMIDGQEVNIGERPNGVFSSGGTKSNNSLQKLQGKWGPLLSLALPVKRHNLQGPIDDAFMDSFLFVKPTRKPMNPQIGKWVDTELNEAVFHWHRFFRGQAPAKDDSAVTEDDIKNNNLVLWGDPSSNKLLAKIADKLPIKWTAKGIVVRGRTYDATKNVPVLIYPNPLNPSRYVVINSGFTFPQVAASSNSLQTPKLPDWAILDMSVPLMDRVGGKGVVDANFFGEKWELVAGH